MDKILIGCGLLIFGILLWLGICYGLTHAVVWLGHGLFNCDLASKFWYIFVTLIIVTYILKR